MEHLASSKMQQPKKKVKTPNPLYKKRQVRHKPKNRRKRTSEEKRQYLLKERESRHWFYLAGQRHLLPYDHVYKTYCKKRWLQKPLLQVLTTEFCLYDEKYFCAAVRDGRIRINGQTVAVDYILQNSDLLSHATHRHEPPISAQWPQKIGQTRQLVVYDKPPHMICHGSGQYEWNSLLKLIGHSCGYRHTPVHRIDRWVSGCVVCAVDPENAKLVCPYTSNAVVPARKPLYSHHKYVKTLVDTTPSKDSRPNEDVSQNNTAPGGPEKKRRVTRWSAEHFSTRKVYVARVKGRFPCTQQALDAQFRETMGFDNQSDCRDSYDDDKHSHDDSKHSRKDSEHSHNDNMLSQNCNKHCHDSERIPSGDSTAGKQQGVELLHSDVLTIRAPMGIASKRHSRWCVTADGSKPSHSKALPVCFDGTSSLVLLTPVSGRTHQLRLHLQAVGHPIATDPKYGGAQYIGNSFNCSHRIAMANRTDNDSCGPDCKPCGDEGAAESSVAPDSAAPERKDSVGTSSIASEVARRIRGYLRYDASGVESVPASDILPHFTSLLGGKGADEMSDQELFSIVCPKHETCTLCHKGGYWTDERWFCTGIWLHSWVFAGGYEDTWASCSTEDFLLHMRSRLLATMSKRDLSAGSTSASAAPNNQQSEDGKNQRSEDGKNQQTEKHEVQQCHSLSQGTAAPQVNMHTSKHDGVLRLNGGSTRSSGVEFVIDRLRQQMDQHDQTGPPVDEFYVEAPLPSWASADYVSASFLDPQNEVPFTDWGGGKS